MVSVDSEAILEIEHDAPSSTLRVRFTDGDWYSYAAVPRALYEAFLAADSHGRFFQAHIRDHYAYRKGRGG